MLLKLWLPPAPNEHERPQVFSSSSPKMNSSSQQSPCRNPPVDDRLYREGVQLYIAFTEHTQRQSRSFPFAVSPPFPHRCDSDASISALDHLNEARASSGNQLPALRWSRRLHRDAENSAIHQLQMNTMLPDITERRKRASSILVRCQFPRVVAPQVLRVTLEAASVHGLDLSGVLFRVSVRDNEPCARAGIAIMVLRDAVFVTVVVAAERPPAPRSLRLVENQAGDDRQHRRELRRRGRRREDPMGAFAIDGRNRRRHGAARGGENDGARRRESDPLGILNDEEWNRVGTRGRDRRRRREAERVGRRRSDPLGILDNDEWNETGRRN